MGAGALRDSVQDLSGAVVEPVYCLGNCALAPAAMVNGRLLGRVTVERLTQAAAEAGS